MTEIKSPTDAPVASHGLSDLGYKIFMDRYALKDGTKKSLAVGDTVVVCVDVETGQREIGRVVAIEDGRHTVELVDGSRVEKYAEHIDKPLETTPAELQARVGRGIAAVEPTEALRQEWEANFRWLMDDWKFVPGGRILTAAGSDQLLTLYNCYVVPSPRDSRGGIVETLSQMMEIMSRGGGVGINVSSLRPRHSYVKGVNGRSSGAVSWGALYSFVTGLIEQGGSRRGALMLICDVWHPDVLEFITSKTEAGKITNANISVGITDDFMQAVEEDGEWELRFPDATHAEYGERWTGDLGEWVAAGLPVVTYKRVRARELWHKIIESAWASAEPGLFFVDRYNYYSNSWYYGRILCTNPCAEQGLPGWGVCNLGAINLGRFAVDGGVNWEELGKAVRYGVRFLDNVIDATPYFFEENERQQKSERRVGLGTMGLAELLIRCGIRYGSPESIEFIDELYKFIAVQSYLASADYAAEKGAFPQFQAEPFLNSGFMRNMPEEVRQAVHEKGCRNVTLLTQAPTGTTGTMAGTSTGIEPFYFWSYYRKSRLGMHEERVGVLQEWLEAHGDEPLPDYFVSAMDLRPEEHVRVEAAIQRWVDSSISKTCNVPNDWTVDETRELYELMYRLGCKGGTIYRDGSRDEQVLHVKKEEGTPAGTARAAVAHEAVLKVRPVPRKRYGVTVSRKTPAGTAHITMNDDEEGRPFEVFIEIGKGGSDIKAMAEGLGRMMSLVLRLASPLTPKERIYEIISQLEGIGGARSTGFGPARVRSLPDAVAQALAEQYGNGNGSGHAHKPHPVETPELAAETAPEAGRQAPLPGMSADLCPSCGNSTLLRVEGCHSCYQCGYAEC